MLVSDQNSLRHVDNSLECSAELLHSAQTGKTYMVHGLGLVRIPSIYGVCVCVHVLDCVLATLRMRKLCIRYVC